MKLYYAPGVCSLSPHIVLRETETPFSLVKVDLKAKTAEDGSDFWAINPSGLVPALVFDDGTILTEGPAIVQYIADKAGATHLAPANGTLPRYKLQSWLNFVSSELHKSFSPILNPAMAPALGPEAKQMFRGRLLHRFGVLDKHFALNDYVMGNGFTVADAYAFTILNWADKAQLDLAPFPQIQKYLVRIQARPSVQAAMKMEGLIS